MTEVTYHACTHTFITAFPAGVNDTSDSWKLNVITKDLSYLLQRQQHLPRGFLYVWPFEFVLEAWHLLSHFSQALPDSRLSLRQLFCPISSFEKWDNHWENEKEVLGPSQFWCSLSVTFYYQGLTKYLDVISEQIAIVKSVSPELSKAEEVNRGRLDLRLANNFWKPPLNFMFINKSTFAILKYLKLSFKGKYKTWISSEMWTFCFYHGGARCFGIARSKRGWKIIAFFFFSSGG